MINTCKCGSPFHSWQREGTLCPECEEARKQRILDFLEKKSNPISSDLSKNSPISKRDAAQGSARD